MHIPETRLKPLPPAALAGTGNSLYFPKGRERYFFVPASGGIARRAKGDVPPRSASHCGCAPAAGLCVTCISPQLKRVAKGDQFTLLRGKITGSWHKTDPAIPRGSFAIRFRLPVCQCVSPCAHFATDNRWHSELYTDPV